MKTTMKTTTKTASILSVISFLALGFAGVAHAGEGAARKGQVSVDAAATKAVVAGPAVVKVYSGFSGATVFVADGDCAAGASGAGTALAADHVETIAVRSGQVACVAGTGARTIELLWHAQSAAPASTLVANR
jgi:hypothetical protein